jgi:hypothetical protein
VEVAKSVAAIQSFGHRKANQKPRP